MVTHTKAANFIMGSKPARACDSCLHRQASWFCAADDAFLCHGCDSLVHSANQLASRHERVRLQTSSSKVNFAVTPKPTLPKAWHSGFRRKARTPRHNNKHLQVQQQRPKDEDDEKVLFHRTSTLLPVVPELESELEPVLEESDEQLLCRVPVFDPFEAHELRNSTYGEEVDGRLDQTAMKEDIVADLDNLSGEFLPLDMDLAEFAVDVESLLGSGMDEDSAGEMKGSELFDCKDEQDGVNANYLGAQGTMVKVKDEEVDQGVPGCHLDSILDVTSHALNWNIDSITVEQEEEDKVVVPVVAANDSVGKVGTKRKICLKLNYEDVISAWASQGSPWTTGNPPEFNISHDCWPDFLGWSGADVEWSYNGEVGNLRRQLLIGSNRDDGREARVSRYREKRRTRLFAKKIRYQVRKLNAEKRPRLKGRFVKTTSFLGSTFH